MIKLEIDTEHYDIGDDLRQQIIDRIGGLDEFMSTLEEGHVTMSWEGGPNEQTKTIAGLRAIRFGELEVLQAHERDIPETCRVVGELYATASVILDKLAPSLDRDDSQADRHLCGALDSPWNHRLAANPVRIQRLAQTRNHQGLHGQLLGLRQLRQRPAARGRRQP